MNTIQQHPVILVLIGIAIKYIIGRRRFNRRGIGGLQHYSNYFTAVITSFIEWVLSWVAIGLMVYGLFKTGCSNEQTYSKSAVQQVPTHHAKHYHQHSN